MVVWLICAVLTALVVFVVLGPLSGRTKVAGTAVEAANIAVYQDQLSEIDGDLERGVITADEAATARVEVSRKILQVADQHPEIAKDGVESSRRANQSTDKTRRQTSPKTLTLVLSGLIPIAAGVTYAGIGAPHMPDLPHAPRLQENLKTATAEGLLARVEARLRSHPGDGKGWDVIAPVYFQARRYGDAADAYRNAIRLLGESPQRLIGYVQSAIGANNGIVTEELRQISERLTKLMPDRAEPKFWLALALEQDGNIKGAQTAYRDLLATADKNAPWKDMVERRLNNLAK